MVVVIRVFRFRVFFMNWNDKILFLLRWDVVDVNNCIV